MYTYTCMYDVPACEERVRVRGGEVCVRCIGRCGVHLCVTHISLTWLAAQLSPRLAMYDSTSSSTLPRQAQELCTYTSKHLMPHVCTYVRSLTNRNIDYLANPYPVTTPYIPPYSNCHTHTHFVTYSRIGYVALI